MVGRCQNATMSTTACEPGGDGGSGRQVPRGVNPTKEYRRASLALLAARLFAAQTTPTSTLFPDTAGFVAGGPPSSFSPMSGVCYLLHCFAYIDLGSSYCGTLLPLRLLSQPPPPCAARGGKAVRPAPPLAHFTGSDFPQVAPSPYGPYPCTPDSEYPLSSAADFAPPPYVKEPEGADAVKYPPPLGPPLGIDAAYSPPPAHLRRPTRVLEARRDFCTELYQKALL
ncbi:hypothetical protein C8R44DRAFT_846701 [Mycena epipterygia]|nr:hypothetical protein C8R44DRAFT_846701 [Mycena epipterygia]